MLDLALTDDITPANTLYMLVRVSRNLELKTALYKWLDKNLDALIAKMPDYHISRMPEFVSTTCSAENLDMAKAFYTPIKDKHEGMARSFDIMLDESNQCLRLKATYQEDFNKFLAKYGN
jgi:alanyl aminopeptidase